jgi:arylsulfatase A-like enzyme
MRFSDAYAPHPNCSPSRLAIQVGKSPAQLNMTDLIGRNTGMHYDGLPMIPPQHIDDIPSEELTVAELIKQTYPEYSTAHFGKWHLGGGGPGRHGYDEHDGETTNKEGQEPPPDPKRTISITDSALDFLERRADGRFFLQVSYFAVHLSVQALPETIATYERLEPGERHNHAGHAAMTEELDTGIGRILAKIDELGLAGNTYVIFTSDNGSYTEVRGEHVTTNLPLRGQKASTWEGGIRVPMIVRGPGVAANSISRTTVIGTDIYPTIRELLDIEQPLPEGIEGGSMAGLLANGGAGSVMREREELVWHWPHYQILFGTTPMSSIRRGDWKLLQFYETDEVQLYSLANDLGEQRNLAREHPERAGELRRRLREYLEAVDAPMARVNPDY